MAEAELARFIDRYTMEFVRHYPHPIERVWRAVTEPGELAQWFISPSVWELKSGGAYRFEDGFKGIIEAVEPPRFIRFNFADPAEAGSYFQFELSPEAGGTRLRYLQHAEPGTARPWQVPHAWDTPWGGGNLGGWHSGFEELADLLDGVPCGSRRPPTAFSAIAQDWADRFGLEFTAEQKAKIVRELRERERWLELCDVYRAHIDATLPPAEGNPVMSNTDLARFIDRYTIEYVRTYPHPIERVWRAIADPAEMSVWFSRIAFEPRIGGAYRALWEEPSMFNGMITAFEPPHLLRFGGPHPGADAHWQFELQPVDGGTRMVFVQCIPPGHDTLARWPLDPPESAPDTPWRPGTLAGWHLAFDGLGDRLDGVVPGSRLPETPFNVLAESWAKKMQARGVYTDSQAARAAASLRQHERDAELANAYRELMRVTCRG